MKTKPQILEACLHIVEERGCRALSLESAARASGLSKPGLMYHFPTKEALMLGVVEHVIDVRERQMVETLGVPFEQSTPAQRIEAFVEAVFSEPSDRVGFAVFADAIYRPASTAAWISRMTKWFELPEDLPEEERDRLNLLRLAADGLWLAQGSGVFALSPRERARILIVLKTHLTKAR